MEKKREEVPDEDCDLLDYALKVVNQLEEKQKFPAAHTCHSALNSITRFLGGESLPMQVVYTPEKLKVYEEWLTQRDSSPNTVSTYMRSLKAVYNRWAPPGSATHNPNLFKEVNTRVESPTKRALTPQQMNKLESTDLDALPQAQQPILAYFRLMFMLRGMPFIDLAHLRKENMQGRTIVYTRHKTSKPIQVDITPDTMRLIKKFRDKTDSVYLFPILQDKADQDSPKKNSPIANSVEEARNRHKHYQTVLRKFNRALAVLMRDLLPGVKVSSYTARHTWATLAFHLGTPVSEISQALGHSSILVTMAYLKPFDHEVIDKINRRVLAHVRQSRWEIRGKATHYRSRK